MLFRSIGQSNKKLKGASTSSKAEERKISSTSTLKDDTLSGLFKKVSDICNQCCKYFIVRLYFATILVEITNSISDFKCLNQVKHYTKFH